MEKTYQPQEIEQKMYQNWESRGLFKAKAQGKAFCIMLPPPNVTGSLHMGHAFQHTLMDILIRYHHMLGDEVHWQVGTDHAGIATQMVVENQLSQTGKTRHDLGRNAFIERVWQWKESSGNTITKQMRRLGLAVDWEHERFTMDEGLSQAVKTAFIKLYHDGLIYRHKRLVNWDPVLKTAVSDLEVIPSEEQGSLWHIRYESIDGTDSLVVATTRPETLLGDVAVAVHPEDERYRHLIGTMLHLPLTERSIPVIADEYVDPSFGTGCVKITPAHDFNDFDMGKRHQLPLINILNKDATLNEQVPIAYQGLDRFTARKKILKDLEQQGLLIKVEAHTLKIPRNDRGGAILEPYLMDQWYVDMKAMAKNALTAVAQGKTTFVPANWVNTYNEWLNNIQDWCISRQLWWGHRIPAWYDDAGNIYVGTDAASIRAEYKLTETVQLYQDEDVLDTWFSSALWPFSTLGWPDKNSKMLNTFYPSSILITGFDIIFFWVARMMMFGLKFMEQVPFEKVYITGLIRDQEGQKMSKTKGNVLDPIDLIDGISLAALIEKRTNSMMQDRLKEKVIKATEKQFPHGIEAHGTDALRFTFAALASHSRDINFDLKRLEGYRNFCNKLWNAARFVLMHVEETQINKHEQIQHPINQWMLGALADLGAKTECAFKEYRFDNLAQELQNFIWGNYCDWYLEFSKVLLADPLYRSETQYILIFALEACLRFLHPITPFITEAIWNNIAAKLALHEKNLLERPYPKAGDFERNDPAKDDVEALTQLISQFRIFRSENQISPAKIISIYFAGSKKIWQNFQHKYLQLINQLARVNLHYTDTNTPLPANFRLDIASHTYHIPLTDFIDVAAELKRTNKELGLVETNISALQQKLSNPSFVDKAPLAVVNKERERLQEQMQQKEKLLEKQAELLKMQS